MQLEPGLGWRPARKSRRNGVWNCRSTLTAVGTLQLTGSGREESELFAKSHSTGSAPPLLFEPEKQKAKLDHLV